MGLSYFPQFPVIHMTHDMQNKLDVALAKTKNTIIDLNIKKGIKTPSYHEVYLDKEKIY